MNAMMRTPAPESAREAVGRLFSSALRAGFKLTGLHRYNTATGDELLRVVRLKYPGWASLTDAEREALRQHHHCDGKGKIIRQMHRTDGSYLAKAPAKPANGWPLYRPPYPLVDTKPLIYVEGEVCADELAKRGIPAVASLGGAKQAGDSDWTAPPHDALQWPDNDQAGDGYMIEVAAKLHAIGCTVERIDVASLNLPEKGDVVNWLAMHPNATADDVLALGRAKVEPEPAEPIDEAPQALPDPLPPVPSFNADWLPASVRAWCVDAADGLQVPLDFTAIPAMVALAGAIGRQVGIAMKRHERWIELPMLWSCVVGRPSSGKSPALAPARRMLERLTSEERKTYLSELRDFEASILVAEATKANAKKAIQGALKKGDRSAAEAAAEAAMFAEEPPSEPRLIVNDATVEKLGELLNANPRGLVQFRDELSGWLASLDREGREQDRGFWLECWNGNQPYTADRIGRGTVRIEACAMSILGGIQPGKLAEYVRGAVRGGFSDDGLIQRFQLAVFPNLPADWQYVDRRLDLMAERTAWATFQRLRNLDPDAIGAERADGIDVPFLRFDDEAQTLLIEWQTELMQRLRRGEEPSWMESHLSKYRSLAGRLALVLHLADHDGGPIGADTLAAALDWCEYLEGHARRIYAPAIDGGLSAAHLILRKRGELGETFAARDIQRKGWAGLSDRDTIGDALELLIEHRHLIESTEATGGRPSIVYRWRASP
ncbi:MAG: DUF3987 domain-containing protein [Xanthomonadaceae bacterium]|nr:DUF3987 domain-containing protein [Xanthomonadaceae bacterium]